MLKSDSTRYPSVEPTHASGPEWPEPDVAEAEAGAGDVVAFAGKKDLPFDLAVDLRLHEILQQARLTTTSSGAVIALARGNRMVCRASLGDKAPGVGVFLNTRSGLAGACVQSREMQLCDDTLVDPRVNATACSDLGIRSIAAQPVLDGEELWGVLEIFSLVPNAYSDSDLQELQGLSRKVLRTVQAAMDGAPAESATEAVSAPLATEACRTRTDGARNLDGTGPTGCSHSTSGLPNRHSDRCGSGDGSASGMDGRSCGLEHGSEPGAGPGFNDFGGGASNGARGPRSCAGYAPSRGTAGFRQRRLRLELPRRPQPGRFRSGRLSRPSQRAGWWCMRRAK